jgi:hypothetical protein
MPYQWRICEIYGWRPEAREGATFTQVFVPRLGLAEPEERLYLFGGLSRDLHGAIGYLKPNTYQRMDHRNL